MPALLPPPASAILRSLPRINYLDAYATAVPDNLNATGAARAFFQQGPAWVGRLLRLRDAVVRRLGLRSVGDDAGPRPTAGPLHTDGFLGPFRVFEATATEVLLGLDDQHLNFRGAVLGRQSATGIVRPG